MASPECVQATACPAPGLQLPRWHDPARDGSCPGRGRSSRAGL